MWKKALKLLSPYEAIIFDLDGTLVRLQVDWSAAQREMAEAALKKAGRNFDGMTVWAMLRASEGELREALESVLRTREIEGARRAVRLPLADLLNRLDSRQLGIVSLNSRESCQIALKKTGLEGLFHVLVAREDCQRMKPDPEPLLRCVEMLGSGPERSVFIGDRGRDRLTAERAGTAFLSPSELMETRQGL